MNSDQPPDYAVTHQPGSPYQRLEDPKKFGVRPVHTICCYCQSKITTHIDYVDGALTYLLVIGICLLGLFCGCCLLPFYWDRCKDIIHTCPVCGADLGRYNRLCPT